MSYGFPVIFPQLNGLSVQVSLSWRKTIPVVLQRLSEQRRDQGVKYQPLQRTETALGDSAVRDTFAQGVTPALRKELGRE